MIADNGTEFVCMIIYLIGNIYRVIVHELVTNKKDSTMTALTQLEELRKNIAVDPRSLREASDRLEAVLGDWKPLQRTHSPHTAFRLGCTVSVCFVSDLTIFSIR